MSGLSGKTRYWKRAAVLTLVALPFSAPAAFAEPLDKESCTRLSAESKGLLTKDMRAALEHGPDWVKRNLNPDAIEKVRHFLSVEEQIQFRCRGGGVDKAAVEKASGVPMPDRNPGRTTSARGAAGPSQALADSVKTPPGKAKATR